MGMKEGSTYMDKRLMRWQCEGFTRSSVGCCESVTLRLDPLNAGKYNLVMTPSSFLLPGMVLDGVWPMCFG